jgi:hypothetical protein
VAGLPRVPSDDRTVDRVFTALLFSLPSSGRVKTASGVPIDRESSDCRTALGRRISSRDERYS